jgi:hypothetical protein
MSAYIAQLRRDVEEQNRIHQLKAEAETIKLRQQERRAKPLTEQIEELMRTLPPQLRDRPWPMVELVNRLQGKYRDRPHPQHVGIALRQLSWNRERRWGQGYDGVRVWTPPAH